MFRRLVAGWLLALCLLPASGHAVQVQATLDRDHVQLGDTVTLNLRVAGADSGIGMPDLDVLKPDFEILGTSQNSSLSVVNGHASSALTIGVALRPTHVGQLRIPALSVAGSLTAPLQLQVSAADPAAAAGAHKDVFMEAQLEPQHGYVGQQLSYVVRLYYSSGIRDGSLESPHVAGVEISQLGDDLNYEAERGGRPYHVLERRYALTPEHAGQLEIPALGFQGVAVDPNNPDSFFGGGSTVSTSAPALTMQVGAIPADWGKSAWLPARQLSLTLDGLPDATQPLRVGQPLNLSMNLQATGLPFDALPALSLPPLDGATVYPDKPVTGNRRDDRWIVGRRQQAFAVVPERAGTLTLPATTVKWWNVQTDQAEVAQIPARSFTVLPALGSTATPPAAVAPTASGASPQASSSATPATPWRWIALGSVGLWLLSMLAWLGWRRRGRGQAAAATPDPLPAAFTSVRQARLAFMAVARGSDSAAQVHALLAWARAERPAIQHLGELGLALDDAGQRAAIDSLQQRHYAGQPAPADGGTLAEAFKPGFRWRTAAAGEAEAGELPPLYPFKLQ